MNIVLKHKIKRVACLVSFFLIVPFFFWLIMDHRWDQAIQASKRRQVEMIIRLKKMKESGRKPTNGL
jgi:hypothetical protein